ncbi:MAG: transketolase family protein [Thermanaerothrix sp.]|nr:transketolase family protein [Thermanaerothrix sp.]
MREPSPLWLAYEETLCYMGGHREDLVVLDSREPTLSGAFKGLFPGRFFVAGTSEQEMVLTAAGLALGGKRVFVSSSSPFLVGRTYDLIRSAVAIPSLGVHLVSPSGGLDMGPDGAPSQMVEDLGLMTAMPGMPVFVPCDGVSTRRIVELLGELKGPSYMRLTRRALPDLNGLDEGDFSIGGARLLTQGEGVTICACGIMVHEALKAARVLSSQGIEAEVIDCYTVRPLAEQVVLSSVRRTGCCVVAEEHSLFGGLGSAVCQCLSSKYPVPVRLVCGDDRFGQSGSDEELREYYGLTSGRIVGAAVQVLSMRRR